MSNPIVSRDEWLDARRELLAAEKAFTRQRDDMSRRLRALPWVRVEKDYVFQGVEGDVTLAELFGDHPQLIIYHFMFGPDWQEGCKSCSLLADSFNHLVPHLTGRNVAFAAISRGPLDQLLAFQKRMGWHFRWLSSMKTDFNFDYQVSTSADQADGGTFQYNFAPSTAQAESEHPGISVFARTEGGGICHTYSGYGRGLEDYMGIYRFLDIVPRGRDEDVLNWGMEWVRHHDRYE